jgi:tetratricopeptide (TPR) repeat protein
LRQSHQFRPFQLACLGAAYAQLGNSGQAIATLNEALSTAEAGGEKQSLATIHRLRGEVLFSLGQSREARHALSRALEIARRQGARLEELRAAMVLARHAVGLDSEDSRQVLMSVYSTFEEGHTLPDLRAARDLLYLGDQRCRSGPAQPGQTSSDLDNHAIASAGVNNSGEPARKFNASTQRPSEA